MVNANECAVLIGSREQTVKKAMASPAEKKKDSVWCYPIIKTSCLGFSVTPNPHRGLRTSQFSIRLAIRVI
jgi:hypothetical protein